ncbi:MAG: hypothetical protein RLZZ436_419 [Planctomycetota bacterium]|jgi:hypothetical protein
MSVQGMAPRANQLMRSRGWDQETLRGWCTFSTTKDAEFHGEMQGIQQYWQTVFDVLAIPRRSWDGETVIRSSGVVFRTPNNRDQACGERYFPVTVRGCAASAAAGTNLARAGRLPSTTQYGA